jgi:ABC-type sugar transport system ATPase subunit
MNEMEMIADRITVLRDGLYIDTKMMDAITMPEVVNLMVGRNVDLYEKRTVEKLDYATAPKALEVKHLNKQGMFEDVSFDLYKGEVLGVAGLVGSGRSELMDILFGITRADSGEILIDGEKVAIRSVTDALDNGIALVPESRHSQGLILIHSISDNISLPVVRRFQKRLVLNHRQKNQFAADMIEKYNVKTESAQKLVNYLSGGNQQKVVVAKWLATDPKILIVDELTAGIDVGSKAEIHKLISGLTEAGMSVVMISSEMPELLAHSDRVMIMNDYKIVGVMEQADQESIMQAIMEDKAKSKKIS